MRINYKKLLPNITTLVFDIDGVFTNGLVTVMPSGELVRDMCVKDGYAVKTAIDKGHRVCVITGGKSQSVKSRLEDLGVKDVYLEAHDKQVAFDDFLNKYKLDLKNILYMGDDLPDYPVMKLAGLPCCPSDAVPEIQKISKYISHKKGGEGCVRDVIEQVLRVQGNWK